MYDASYLFHTCHSRALYWLTARGCNPTDAEDVLATSYLKAVEALNDGQEVRYPVAWFKRIVRNAWLDMLKYRGRVKRPDEHCMDLDLLADVLADPDMPDRIMDSLSAAIDLDDLFAQTDMSAEDRWLLLASADGCTGSDLAEMTGMRLRDVERRRQSGMKRLRAASDEDVV